MNDLPKRKRGRIYWPRELDNIIAQYNASTDMEERERLFREHLDYPLDKMAENIINRFKFPYINESFDEIKKQVVSFLVINLHKYTPDKGKSFSYFSVIAKNHLILFNNLAYKEEKRNVLGDEDSTELQISIDESIELYAPNEQEHEDFKEFTKLMVEYWDANIPRFFKKQRDIEIANAVLELFKRADRIENYNKKAIFLLIREMTNCKTSYITKVINKMKVHVDRQLKDFHNVGSIQYDENKFFRYTK